MSVRIVTAFLCERITLDANGKANAFGLGPHRFSAQQYPIPPFQLIFSMIVEADASEIGTKHAFQMAIQDADGQDENGADAEMLITPALLRTWINQEVRISAKKPGLKQFVLRIDGKTVVQIPMEFLRLKISRNLQPGLFVIDVTLWRNAQSPLAEVPEAEPPF